MNRRLVTNIRKSILNTIRQINKIPFIENYLAKRTQGKNLNNFWTKLLPPQSCYKKGSVRFAERNGIQYELDISDYIQYVIYFGLNVEPKETLYKSIKDGMFIFDIGVNIGETLLNISKINKNGKNFGFEPVPFLYEKALKNIHLNKTQNISLINEALSDREGTLFFELPIYRNYGGIHMSTKRTDLSYEVRATTLDNFIHREKIEKVDFIKIDVEGFEANVLAGADYTIRKYKPILFIEIIDEHLKRNNTSAEKIISKLIQLGYSVSDADTLQIIKPEMDFSLKRHDILCKPKMLEQAQGI